jgi:hypothetical protein
MSYGEKPSAARNVPLIISFFAHTSDSELALADLMSEGLSEQDFTFVQFGDRDSAGLIEALECAVEPFARRRPAQTDQVEDSLGIESQIGGGIETASPDDDVSSVEEMDDSESAAQGLLYPAGGRSVEGEEAREIQIGANSGFFQTTKPAYPNSKFCEPVLTSFRLNGIGLVVGEGSFGERIIEALSSEGVEGVQALIGQWMMPTKHGSRFLDVGILLAIDVEVTGPLEDRVSDILRARGAQYVNTVAPCTA